METRSNVRNIHVYAHWVGMNGPLYMGELRAEFLRGKETFSFSYADSWLKSKYSQVLDPELLFYSGSQFAEDNKSNFGVFLDSSPDRWGRFLMKRVRACRLIFPLKTTTLIWIFHLKYLSTSAWTGIAD